MQKKLASLLLIGFTLSGSSSVLFANNTQNDIQEARKIVKQYASSLKHELKTALKEKGTTLAVESCHLKAPDISDNISQSSGWLVRRTSLKVRNLEDTPDKWENTVLQKFEKMHQAGTPVNKIEFSEVVTKKDGSKEFRYMKAIPTKKVCLQCHGSNIKSKVASQLDSLYPFDRAVGFKVNDLRGAFSLSKPIK